ncbi:hypothetical protein QK289_15500 [Exiguobacterium antarcticum]|uniref:Type II secretion system protein GspF domain-containing protein n=1 Tax=Exiguobacterium antarcticum TaxID=132920 RepID=A0ABT6R636_9BACL|nr:hypothetical protein [Exiguobacterium antarcticum]MDI3236420.1 hypothetical protein [Exiguobacterium antarcticum]
MNYWIEALIQSHLIDLTVLAVLTILAYFVIMQFLEKKNKKQRRRLSNLLNERQKGISFKKKYPLLERADPTYFKKAAERYGVNFDNQMYFTQLITGTAVGAVLFIVYFNPFLYLIPFALLGGVIAAHIKLHAIKRDYILDTEFKLTLYMSGFTSSYATFGNLKQSIESILEDLPQPIKGDLEKAYIILEDGRSVKEAFHAMNEKYPDKIVKMFHQQLEVLSASGSSDTSTLRNIVRQMKKKEVFKKRLSNDHRSKFKVWRMFALMAYSIPFMFILISYDNYETIKSSPITSVVYLIASTYTYFIYKKLESIELYDPTESEQIYQ